MLIARSLANVAGTQEPEYGPSAIQSVVAQAEKVPYTELSRKDLKWKAMGSTCVETQTFYFTSDTGVLCMAQVIYSNVGGIRTTCQFNSKIFDHDGSGKHLWCSDPLENYGFDEEKVSFFADNVDVSLSDDGASYTIRSAVNEGCLVNLKFTRTSPGFQVGKDGTTYFGTNPAEPWGSMVHKFWPRCTVEGSMTTKEKEYDMKGRGIFIHALQGMKPHHAAAKWTFLTFHTPTYSAVMMEFTTPPSYAKTVVNVGGIVKDGEILYAGAPNKAIHLAVSQDSENDWPEPKAILFEWTGKTKDGKQFKAEIMGELGPKKDRVDVLAHIPGFVKTIVGGVVGTRPYIYQYSSDNKLSLSIKVDGVETTEQGFLFSEATFIS